MPGPPKAAGTEARPTNLYSLVPKLGLGTHLQAKLSLASTFVPKCNLGTSEGSPADTQAPYPPSLARLSTKATNRAMAARVR